MRTLRFYATTYRLETRCRRQEVNLWLHTSLHILYLRGRHISANFYEFRLMGGARRGEGDGSYTDVRREIALYFNATRCDRREVAQRDPPALLFCWIRNCSVGFAIALSASLYMDIKVTQHQAKRHMTLCPVIRDILASWYNKLAISRRFAVF